MKPAERKYQAHIKTLTQKLSQATNLYHNLNKKKQTKAIIKSKQIQSKKIVKYRNSISRLRTNRENKKRNAKTKHRHEVATKYRNASLKNMKSDKEFSSLAYLMPKNPASDSSYALMFVTDISEPHSTNVASKAVEYGMNMATTTQKNATTITVTATLGGHHPNMKEANKYHKKIIGWVDNGVACVFRSKEFSSDNVLISDYTPQRTLTDVGTGINTTNVSLTLVVANYFQTNKSSKKNSSKNVGHKGAKKGSKSKKNSSKKGSSDSKQHHYIIAKNGDNYINIARKKGVKLSHIKQLNKYADRQIPIGSKIFY